MWSARLPLLALLGLAPLLLAGECSDGFQCECVPCGFAITAFVVDGTGAAATGEWNIEATLDGQLVDTSECETAARNGINSCGFGFDTGVYQGVLRTPTAEKPFTARFAGRAGQNCCNCLLGDTTQVSLP
jgi:hypothetical protein